MVINYKEKQFKSFHLDSIVDWSNVHRVRHYRFSAEYKYGGDNNCQLWRRLHRHLQRH